MSRSDRKDTRVAGSSADLSETAAAPAWATAASDPRSANDEGDETEIFDGRPRSSAQSGMNRTRSFPELVDIAVDGLEGDETLVGAGLAETGERPTSSAPSTTSPQDALTPSVALLQIAEIDAELASRDHSEEHRFEGERTDTDEGLQVPLPELYAGDDDETQFATRPAALAVRSHAPAQGHASAISPTLRAEYRGAPGLLDGRYRILSLIGSGGMGAVYEGEHVELGKRVAVKIVNSVDGPRAELAARFKREARSTSSLDHDHIVQVFDAGEDPAYGLFMVMELLRGEDLERVISSRGALPPRVAARVVYQACLGLEAAHAAHILHRDLKPANIFLARGTGDVLRTKIVDFGLVKFAREVSGLNRGNDITRAGIVLGTPQYMSPEQAQGLENVDARADIYSLGAVFYEALVGRPVVPEYPNYERTLHHILSMAAPRVSESVPTVPVELDELVAAMLLPVELRIASAREVREKLILLYPDLEGSNISLPPPADPSLPPARAAERMERGRNGSVSGVIVGSPARDARDVRDAGDARARRVVRAERADVAAPDPFAAALAPPSMRTSPLEATVIRLPPRSDPARALLIAAIAVLAVAFVVLMIVFAVR